MRESIKENIKKRLYLRTYGCQMNVHDSERMIGLMESAGYVTTDTPEDADVVVINTCAVREKPERKLLAELGHLKRLKSKNPNLIVGVAGCMAPRDGDIIRTHAPFVDMLIGPRSLAQLPDLVRKVELQRRPLDAIDLLDDPTPLTPVRRASNLLAWVDIVFGCSFACTFCAVPSARGTERSRLPEDVFAEVTELKMLGYKEITLLGQTVNAYGRDWHYRMSSESLLHSNNGNIRERIDFAWLLEQINQIAPEMRIRFTSPHPQLFNDRLIDAISRLSNICEHIHLPLQSADNDVLNRMKRAYSVEQFKEIVRKLRERIPDIAITTDIIVGFPGETESAFQRTLDVFEELEFDQAFMFAYSPRRQTAAFHLTDPLPGDVANQRLQRLIDVANKQFRKQNEALVGKVYEVLVEGRSEKDSTRLMGRTRQNKTVVFNGKQDLIGKLVNLKMTKGFMWGFEGRMIE